MKTKATLTALAIFAGLAVSAGSVLAHEKHDAKKASAPVKKEQKPWGIAGDAKSAKRTIEIAMSDDMRFTPSVLEVKQGETVKFVVRNSGKVMHEMVLGTEPELRKHAELMKKHPGMEHDEPYMAHVQPGKKEEIAWTFTKPGTFMYGCLVPGHWEAGMKGTIVVN